jgi:ferric-dicitrate binding protein FerR (iron transport regulator)
LTAFREPAADAVELAQWVETALAHESEWQHLEQVDEHTGEIKTLAHIYVWEREQTAVHPERNEPFTWQERVLVTHSLALQAGMTKNREKSC